MVILSVVVTILALLGAAVGYTQHISRLSQRSRKTALAVEIADGHLEKLFTNWRNISRVSVTQSIKNQIQVVSSALPTQYFFTTGDGNYPGYNPGPAPAPSPSPDPNANGLTSAPPLIAIPDKSLFPDAPGYTVGQYRIQAITPMVELQSVGSDSEVSIVPVTDVGSGDPSKPTSFRPAFGPNTSPKNGQYSFYYLAGADITVPSIGPNSGVTAKVRRIFEKKFDEPFSYALFYIDDLEAFPTSPLSITGPIMTNSSLYIGTSNFAAAQATTQFPTSGTVGFGTSFVNGPSPNDPTHSTGITYPSFPDRQPPSMQPPYLPFGWSPNLDGTTINNRTYHQLIERPDVTATDPIKNLRFYNQADYGVIITPGPKGPTDEVVNVIQQSVKADGTWDGNPPIALTNGTIYNNIVGAVTTSKQLLQVIQDNRESGGLSNASSAAGQIRLTTVDVASISKNVNKANSTNPLGMIYVSDTLAAPGDGVAGVAIYYGGSGYSNSTTVTFSPPSGGGTTARGVAIVNTSGAITAITVTSPGSGYTVPPTVTLSGSGSLAVATAILGTKPDSVVFGSVTNSGSGYSTAPSVTFTAPTGAGGITATATAVVSSGYFVAISITNAGGGYITAPTITLSGGGGTGAAVTAILGLKRGIRVMGANINPVTGLSVVAENPVYIQGDYNTGNTFSSPPQPGATPATTSSPASNSGGGTTSTASPLVTGYNWKPSAIVADAITLLSNNWSDATSNTQPRTGAKHTTVNAALVTGIVPSDGTTYSGGAENFVRLLENWSSARFTYYGSMVQLWQSKQATAPWNSGTTIYTPQAGYNWFYDIHFAGDPNNPAGNAYPNPPGNFQLAAYLQQQRWYQVY